MDIEAEIKVIERVADNYGLSEFQRCVLFSIRRVEDGKTGLEFGVSSDYPSHPARRYKKSPARSLYIQASWVSGGLQRHVSSVKDLEAYSKRYCPPNSEHWHELVLGMVTAWEESGSEDPSDILRAKHK